MREGIILKGVGGQYEVQVGDGVCLCTLRGRLRLEDIRVMVGDRVKVTVEGEQGVVEEILPRQSELIRPAIANIDQVVVVFAAAKPKPSLILLDRILVQAELARLDALLVINKSDLALEEAKRLQEMYGSIPYRTVIVSAKEVRGLDEVRQELTGKMSTLAGPSGVGKSSLLNALLPELELEVQSVSRKVQRGRHTTRTVTLLPLPDGGFVADTPGFSVLNLVTWKRNSSMPFLKWIDTGILASSGAASIGANPTAPLKRLWRKKRFWPIAMSIICCCSKKLHLVTRRWWLS